MVHQEIQRWNPRCCDSTWPDGTRYIFLRPAYRGLMVGVELTRILGRRKSNSLQAKAVSQPNEVVMSKPRVQQRPSGKEGVQPFEIAATAATPKDENNARESFMMGMEYPIQGGRRAVGGEVKSRDEEARQIS